ncbi:NAD dependent epimerase/dehydratase [Skermanella stibiiresistens SB22]|uniref:NAD dependent epimerase/dehydratase n=1 Tax=Skermanella stibiiresistens SB22 TaxID=1385369 RepID=W9H5Y5_9PROT|nr:SDR family oxidoreductase [Skermanella stibiiresistens]EWY39163.1 NAD dependent epimerase/dehydratase [Skermanella stibiiresistens SB22]
MLKSALIVGAGGIVGGNLAERLIEDGWTVHGLARRPTFRQPAIKPIAADLTKAEETATALKGLDVSHVFISAWSRQATEAENVLVNGGMVRNLMDAIGAAPSLKHVALVTGLKHYLGPFEAYGAGAVPETPFREEQGRQEVANFYYTQEDEVFAAAKREGFGWSVHRPHTIIGYAVGNAMNMGVTLAVHAEICRETGTPFAFPGSATQWNGLTDITDARLLARHLEWAATSDAGRDQDFNVVNGDIFRWKWLWPRIAAYFGVEPAPFSGEIRPLEQAMADAAPIWRRIAERHDLVEPDVARLASWWHTDADLGRPMEVVTDMTKSRKAGFLDYQSTPDSFYDLFARLREERIIPDHG